MKIEDIKPGVTILDDMVFWKKYEILGVLADGHWPAIQTDEFGWENKSRLNAEYVQGRIAQGKISFHNRSF